MRLFPTVLLTLAGSLAAAPALAAEFFQVRNEGLLSRAVSLPALRPLAPEAGKLELGASLEVISEFVERGAGSEWIRLDGETTKLSLMASGRYGARTHWQLRIPVLYQSGGALDGTIEGWHDLWGLPNGGRPQAPRDRRHYLYMDGADVRLDHRDTSARIGDVEVAWHFDAVGGLRVSAQLQLPSGDSDRLAGGGTLGGSVWASYLAQQGRWSGFVAGGMSFNGHGDILPGQQRRATPFAGAGVGVDVLPRLRLVGQVYAHPGLFRGSELAPLTRDSVQLTLGGIVRLGQDLRLHLLFQEDLGVNASPDFSLQIALHW